MWKKAIVDYFKALSQHLLGVTGKSTNTLVRIASLGAKFGTSDLPETMQEC